MPHERKGVIRKESKRTRKLKYQRFYSKSVTATNSKKNSKTMSRKSRYFYKDEHFNKAERIPLIPASEWEPKHPKNLHMRVIGLSPQGVGRFRGQNCISANPQK